MYLYIVLFLLDLYIDKYYIYWYRVMSLCTCGISCKHGLRRLNCGKIKGPSNRSVLRSFVKV